MTKEELLKELQAFIQENNTLKSLIAKEEAEFVIANKELAFQNDEKEKRAAELIIANKELAFQNDEKERRAAKLVIANKELILQNDEKEKRAAELVIANKELAFQNDEKEKRAAELIIANKELAFQNDEKEKRAAELIIANKELAFQNDEKEKRAAELVIANKELAFQNDLKEKRAAELIIANKELAFQNDEKEKRAAELIIANNELAFQNELKEKRAAELIIANKELAFQNDEKEKRAAELIIANNELAFQNDLKEKRAAELILAKEKAEEFENKFRQIAENIDEVFWLRTKSEMIYISPSFEKIWGIPCQDIYEDPKMFTDRIHPDDKSNVEEIVISSEFNDLGLFNYEYRILRTANQIRWINAKTFPIIDDTGQILKRVGIASDITEKYESNLELIKSKEHAEQSDRLKSAFLANMSHEIRTPMNGILGFASILKEADLTGEERSEYLELMEQSGIRMLNIINDIVDISKIESGLMELHSKETNINEQIDYIFTFFKPEMDKKKIKFSSKKSLAGKDAVINSDREKIYAILTNLVKNAIKYTDEGSIEFGYNVRTENETSVLEFYIKDTGIGIPKNRQEAIFERFIQADINDKMARQGAGLGLSISKAFVELLGGDMWVNSEEGIGSTFYFSLPYITEPKETINKQTDGVVSPIKPEVEGLKILIAEDDETSGQLISITVKKISKEILRARTGTAAVEICHNNPDIDLILMDIQMPDMNGYDATRQIRQFNNDVIIIAQTAFGLSGDREKTIAAGCNDYIGKPINKSVLLELIQKHFTH
ncbi:MAG: ATP-binding protein [Candidatus Kapabacteria bacterium]|nr:ATP-binding protein [Candidatus Kapabacteria bacterium]